MELMKKILANEKEVPFKDFRRRATGVGWGTDAQGPGEGWVKRDQDKSRQEGRQKWALELYPNHWICFAQKDQLACRKSGSEGRRVWTELWEGNRREGGPGDGRRRHGQDMGGLDVSSEGREMSGKPPGLLGDCGDNSAILTDREPWSKGLGKKIRDSTLNMLNLGFLWNIQVEMPWNQLDTQVWGLRRESGRK